MVTPVLRLLLRLWGRVPLLVRQWIVRLFAPSFTVGAACVVERDDGAILLVRLVYRDGWGLPGGLVDRREDIAVCARREVREETGLAIDLVSEPAVVVDPSAQRVDVAYRARPAEGVDPAAARPRSVEVAELGWFPPESLPELQPEAVSELVALARLSVVPPGVPGGTGVPGAAAVPNPPAPRITGPGC